jgi:hypothetical protein
MVQSTPKTQLEATPQGSMFSSPPHPTPAELDHIQGLLGKTTGYMGQLSTVHLSSSGFPGHYEILVLSLLQPRSWT